MPRCRRKLCLRWIMLSRNFTATAAALPYRTVHGWIWHVGHERKISREVRRLRADLRGHYGPAKAPDALVGPTADPTVRDPYAETARRMVIDTVNRYTKATTELSWKFQILVIRSGDDSY